MSGMTIKGEYILQTVTWREDREAQARGMKELIRCKDCKYYKVYELKGHTLPLCNRIKTTMADSIEEDDYCSKAERKDE